MMEDPSRCLLPNSELQKQPVDIVEQTIYGCGPQSVPLIDPRMLLEYQKYKLPGKFFTSCLGASSKLPNGSAAQGKAATQNGSGSSHERDSSPSLYSQQSFQQPMSQNIYNDRFSYSSSPVPAIHDTIFQMPAQNMIEPSKYMRSNDMVVQSHTVRYGGSDSLDGSYSQAQVSQPNRSDEATIDSADNFMRNHQYSMQRDSSWKSSNGSSDQYWQSSQKSADSFQQSYSNQSRKSKVANPQLKKTPLTKSIFYQTRNENNESEGLDDESNGDEQIWNGSIFHQNQQVPCDGGQPLNQRQRNSDKNLNRFDARMFGTNSNEDDESSY